MKNSIIKTLERDIQEKHLSKHKFYELWNEGKVSLDAIRAYAQQYYKFVSEFPRFVSRVHSNTPYEEDRLIILENLNEEENKELPHSELWLRFAEGIGVKRSKMNVQMLPETKKMLNELRKLTSKNFLEGSAAILAYEAQISEIAKLKMDGLKKHYNVTGKKTLEFFDVHSEVDIEHQNTWKKIIEKHAKTKKQKAIARKALNKSLKAMWHMLDGVYRAYC